jgi:NAD(P)-dependent dehydrogenase (short-subunit alcohol dehydrogenase family)
MKDFEGLVAVVTGAAAGIGAFTAQLLSERGARVAMLDLNDAGATGQARAWRCDVSDDDSVREAMAGVEAAFARVDIVVNNAGIGAQGSFEDAKDDEWHRLFDVNVVGIARVTRAALPLLRRSKHASIVNVSSVVADVGVPQRAVYAATKGAVRSLSLAMAADLVADGVRVNCVLPGTADTPWIDRLLDHLVDPQAERKSLAARQPLGRLVDPAEVAYAIAYLASPLSSATTGSALVVDGGMSSLRLPR